MNPSLYKLILYKTKDKMSDTINVQIITDHTNAI